MNSGLCLVVAAMAQAAEAARRAMWDRVLREGSPDGLHRPASR